MGENGSAIYRLKPAGARGLGVMSLLALGLAALGVTGAVLFRSSPGNTEDPVLSRQRARDLRVPEPVAPAFAATDPTPIRPDKWDSVWAIIERPTAVRARPAPNSRVVGRLSTVTPEGTDNIVLILDREMSLDNGLWVNVSFPSLPNGAAGWVPRDALGGYGVVHSRLIIDLAALSARLYQKGRLVFESPVGIGEPQWPTPTGTFYVRNRLAGFGDPFYGPVAFGTSARSSVLTDWPAGGFVGIHGTDRPNLIPGRVSHGCVRMRNRDIRRLDRLMPIGTPVIIQP